MYLNSLHVNGIDVIDDYAKVVGKFNFRRQKDVLSAIKDYIFSRLGDFLDLDVDGEDFCLVDFALSNSRKCWYPHFRLDVICTSDSQIPYEYIFSS